MNWSKFFFGVGGLICLALRIFLVFTNIDPDSGFFISNGIAVSFYNTMLLLALLIIVGYGLFRMKPKDFVVKQPVLLTLASAACGIAILLSTGFTFIDYLKSIFQYSDPLSHLSGNVFAVVLEIVRLFLGLTAGATLLSFAISGGKLFRRSGMLLTPAVWTLIYLIQQFLAYPQIADMSDRVLWMLTLLFFTLAMVGQARIIRNVKPQKGAKYVCAYGYAAALCGLVLGISQLVTMQKVCTIETNQWLLTTAMALHSLAMASSCQIEGEK